MVAAHYAYSKGRTFVRVVSGTFLVLFGFFALFFASAPKLWNSRNATFELSGDSFNQNRAYADVPHTGDAPGGGDGCADSCGSCASSDDDGVDSVGDSVGGGVGDSSGGCGDDGSCSA